MKRFATLRNARLLQILGLVVAVVGLSGFWFTRDVARSELNEAQQALVNPEGEAFQASFVVAGRDYDISSYASPCRYVGRSCVRDRVGTFQLGNRTDTILYVNITGDAIAIVAIPRDIWLPQWRAKVNAMYGYQHAEGLKRSVEEILGLPVDYYAVISIDIFKDVVDALGGVDLNIPYDMDYTDAAAGLDIHFDEGPAHLDGDDAAKFVRYRHTLRGDYDRIDNVKRLAYAMLAKVKQLNVRAVGTVPALVDSFLNDVETNASPVLVRRLIPRIGNLRIEETATLPTREITLAGGEQVLGYDTAEVESFLAETFGGTARDFAEAPAATLLITNRSGQAELAEWYRDRLIAMGVPAERIVTREGSFDPSPTRVLATSHHWQEADYYTSLLRTSKQQIDRLPAIDRLQPDLELVLGEDAAAVAHLPEPDAAAAATRSDLD